MLTMKRSTSVFSVKLYESVPRTRAKSRKSVMMKGSSMYLKSHQEHSETIGRSSSCIK